MRGFSVTLAALGLLLAIGCEQKYHTLDRDPKMTGQFNPAAASYIDRLGTGTISGRTFHADTFSGAQATLQLIPVTDYSLEYMRLLFGESKAYYRPTKVANLDSEFRRYQRHTRADVNGNYSFSQVPPGEYFIYSQLVENRSGVAMFERVKLSDGQQLRIDVSGT